MKQLNVLAFIFGITVLGGIVFYISTKLMWQFGYHVEPVSDSLKVIISQEIISLSANDLGASNAKITSDSIFMLFSGGIGDSLAYMYLINKRPIIPEEVTQDSIVNSTLFESFTGVGNKYLFIGINSENTNGKIYSITSMDSIIFRDSTKITLSRTNSRFLIGDEKREAIFLVHGKGKRQVLILFYDLWNKTAIFAFTKYSGAIFTDTDLNNILEIINMGNK